MNLQLLPQALALFLAAGAFGVVWAVGLASDVPLHVVSLRAVGGAAAFWVAGLFAGKAIMNAVYESIGERLSKANDNPPGGGKK